MKDLYFETLKNFLIDLFLLIIMTMQIIIDNLTIIIVILLAVIFTVYLWMIRFKDKMLSKPNQQ